MSSKFCLGLAALLYATVMTFTLPCPALALVSASNDSFLHINLSSSDNVFIEWQGRLISRSTAASMIGFQDDDPVTDVWIDTFAQTGTSVAYANQSVSSFDLFASSSVSASSLGPSYWGIGYGTALFDGAFLIHGAGTLSVHGVYDLQQSSFDDEPKGFAYAAGSVAVSLDGQGFSQGAPGSGTFDFAVDVVDNQRGRFFARAGTYDFVSIPEPCSLILLSFSLAALLLYALQPQRMRHGSGRRRA